MSLSDFSLCIDENVGISPGCTGWGSLLTLGAFCCLERVKPLPQDAAVAAGCVCELVTGGRMGTANICLREAFPEVPPVPGLCPGSAARGSQLAAAAALGHIWVVEHREMLCAAGNAVLRSYRTPSITATLPSSAGNSFLGTSLDVSAGNFRRCS